MQLRDLVPWPTIDADSKLTMDSRVIIQTDHTEYFEPVAWRVGQDEDGSAVLIIDAR